ncbi:unnamed protein product [Prorocentrum cordatum]|uniref:5'-nucleotidase n=1 Tax=Prorocentrum cordatum TaxID=2364126 RepID=A0ABN9WJ13_9DINO|nr:unnamed protein product [Polarella glacialis]
MCEHGRVCVRPAGSWAPQFLARRCAQVGLEDRIYANTYVDLGVAEVVGFDYDYTLVRYKHTMLDLIYNVSCALLMSKFGYPEEMAAELTRRGYDPQFAIRGVAVDLETAWVCCLTARYRVSVAYYGRQRVSEDQVRLSYKSRMGAGRVGQEERRARLKPLNDWFGKVEACLLADVVQWLKDRDIPFEPKSVLSDVIDAVVSAHVSKAIHRQVEKNWSHYAEPGELRPLLEKLEAAGKKLMLVSNSPYWYVNSGMSHAVGDDWKKLFDVVVVDAGKPKFYTDDRPFREVSQNTGRKKFKKITSIDRDEVYCEGCIGELMRLTGWGTTLEDGYVDGSKIIYLGDSLFADLVEARRLFGWTTGAIIPEVAEEANAQSTSDMQLAWHSLQLILHCLRGCQEPRRLGP